MTQEIAILRLSALGDAVLVAAALERLRAHAPKARISWIIGQAAFSLLEGMPGINFIVIDKPKRPQDYWRLYKQFKAYRFDVLLAMQASLRSNLILPLIKAKRKIGFDKARARDGQSLFTDDAIEPGDDHLLDSFMKFVAKLGADDKVVRWNIPIPEDAWNWACTYASHAPILAVNPCASKGERDWPIDRLCQVLWHAHETYGYHVILTGGATPREIECGHAIANRLEIPLDNIIGKTSPKQLIAILKRAEVLLAPDTGPVHMARAMGTPVIGLYAVATAKLTGPYSAMEYCVDKYPLAVETLLNMKNTPVGLHTRVHDPKAMQLISVSDVLEKLALVHQNLAQKKSKGDVCL